MIATANGISILDALEGVKSAGQDTWQALCPCHDDSTASLSITREGDKTLVYCHAGCPTADVVKACGLTMADLGPRNGNGSAPHIDKVYDYRNGDGTLEFQVVRMLPKDFRQRRNANDWKVKGCKVVPYRLPELLRADPAAPVFVVEGEKDCDNLAKLGIVATCNAGGAGKWREDHAKHLQGRHVVILPDNDDPGRKHAEQVRDSLAGIARSVKVVELPGLSPKGDVSDWLKAGGTAAKLLELAATVETTGIKYSVITSAELAKGDYAIEFLIENTLAARQPLIIAGAQKTLKTSFIVDGAISLATGGYFLGKLKVNRAVRVMVMTGESGFATIQENAINVCRAAGTWLDDIANLFWSEDLPKFGDAAHLDAVRALLTEYEIEVLFIDPAYLCLPSTDSGNVMAQGELLRGMAEVCRECGCLMVLAHHTKKNTGRDPFDVPELSDIAWSGFAEFCRQWWLIGRREKYEPGTGSHKLWLSIGGSAGHGALWAVDVEEGTRDAGRKWEVDIHAPNDARQQTEQRKDEAKAKRAAEQLAGDVRKVLDTLAGFPDGAGTKTDLKGFSGLRDTRLTPAIASALKSKFIAPIEIVKGNKQTYDGYKLNPESSHPDAPG